MDAGETVWVVQASCGDYYCEGVHLVAIGTTPEEAELLRIAADEKITTHQPHGNSSKTWEDIEVVEVPVGVLR